VLWGPEDWDEWSFGAPNREPARARAREAVLEILGRLPGRERMTVADLGCGRGTLLPFLVSEFGQVVAIDYAPATLAAARREAARLGVVFRRRDLRNLAPFRKAFHVAVAVDSILGPRSEDVNRILEEIFRSLVEGGVFVGTFPARPRKGRLVPLLVEPAGPAPPDPVLFTEMDLQYRLRRAGFLGARIRRLPDLCCETLLAVAVRRAPN